MRAAKIARRGFLIGSAAILGGVAFGAWRYLTPYENPVAGMGRGAITPYVLIDADGVSIIAPRAEMGQGIQSTLAALVAEELDLPWDQVRVQHGPPASAYYNGKMLEDAVPFPPHVRSALVETLRHATEIPAKFLAVQLTGGSTSVPDGYEKMRAAGAVARAALIEAAARQLGIAAAQLTTEGGAVIAPDGTRLAYVDLAEAAANAPLPKTPALKPRESWKLLGKDLPRLDLVEKSTGTALYAGDIRRPGMRFATIRRIPVLAARMTGYDAAAAEVMPGVERIIPLPDGVAVVARTTWHAIEAARAVTLNWEAAPVAQDSASIRAEIAASFTPDRLDATPRDEGDVASLSGDAFTAEYHLPFLAHATMEPMQAAAEMRDGKLEIWVGSQAPGLAQSFAAKAVGLPTEAVTLHCLAMGGGFGRRAEVDATVTAALVAKAMAPTPVLVTWSREEDMSHDMYRPMTMGRVRAHLRDGQIEGFDLETAAPSIIESLAGRADLPLAGPDSTLAQGAWDQPYGFANYRVRAYRAPASAPLGFWRSVGASTNAFIHDCAMDELAHLAGKDPLRFRLDHMIDTQARAVLTAVAEMSGWDNPRPGRAMGVGFCTSFGVPTAEVVEVTQSDRGIRITGLWAAVDPGLALNPDTIRAQVSGAMIFGLSAAVRGAIDFADGGAVQENFWDYEPLRADQIPDIEVRILEGGGPIRGIGEPGTPPAAPALANALYALTGVRARELPLSATFNFA